MRTTQKRLAAIILVATTFVGFLAPATLADDYSYVNSEHLNVRSLGSVRGKIVATVDKGYRMSVLETLSNGWKRVLLENGAEGFVNGKYLSEEAPYYEKVESVMYSVKVAHAFVRSDGLLRKIAVVDSGDQLEAVSDRVYFGKWIRVRVVSSANEAYIGRVGYISKRLVDPVEAYSLAEDVVQEMDAALIADESETFTEEAYVPELNSAPEESTMESTDSESTEASNETSSQTSSEDEDLSKLLEGL